MSALARLTPVAATLALMLSASVALGGPDKAACDTTKSASCCTRATEVTGLADPDASTVEFGDQPETRSIMTLIRSDDDGSSLKIKIVNGEVESVTIDGDAVPTNRVRNEHGTITILDEDGNQIASFDIGFADGDHASFATAAGAGHMIVLDADQVPGGPPKVIIGINLSDPDGAVLEHLGLHHAIRIDKVWDGTPAARAGLRVNDLIFVIDGHDGISSDKLRELMAGKNPGDEIVVKLIRKGERKVVRIKLDKFKEGIFGGAFPGGGAGTFEIRPGIVVRRGPGAEHQMQLDMRVMGNDSIKQLMEQLQQSGQLSGNQLEQLAEQLRSHRIGALGNAPGGNQFFGRLAVPGQGENEQFQFFTISPENLRGSDWRTLQGHAAPPIHDAIERLSDRLDSLEDKLDRIERALDRLANQRRRGN